MIFNFIDFIECLEQQRFIKCYILKYHTHIKRDKDKMKKTDICGWDIKM